MFAAIATLCFSADRTPGAGVLPLRDADEKGGEAGTGCTEMRQIEEEKKYENDRLPCIQGEM